MSKSTLANRTIKAYYQANLTLLDTYTDQGLTYNGLDIKFLVIDPSPITRSYWIVHKVKLNYEEKNI